MLALRHPRRPLAGFALLALCVYATALAIVSSPLLAKSPRVISGAVTFDLLVTVPLLYWLMVVRRTRVPAVTLLPLFLAGLAAARVVLPARYQGWLALATLVLAPAAEVAVLAFAAVRARKMIRRLRAGPRDADSFDAFRDALEETTGSHIVAYAIASEVALVWYALLSWRARPRVAEGDLAFTNDRRTGAAGLLFGLGVASTMELMVVHVLAARESGALAWVLTAASAYTLLWIVGFARALRLRPVTLGTESMRLRVGLLWDVTIPYAAIEAVDAAPRTPIDRDAPGYLHAAFAGTPQTVLTLAAPVDAIGIYGIRRKGVRRIGVYVDDPGGFRDALRARAVAAGALPSESPAPTSTDVERLDEARRAWADRWKRE